ncbi:MAG: caspase family protein [Planctomycetaceae bacterium]|jgi:uncharacterized caspase-like protein|nr:caspase family protein [Planctomycetaceae bacterium]
MITPKFSKTLLILASFFLVVAHVAVAIGASPKNSANRYATRSTDSELPSHANSRVATAAGARYALLVGVNDYDNNENEKRAKATKRPFFNLKNLHYCCNDMIVLHETLINTKFAAPENIVLLTSSAEEDDKKATITNINRELKCLLGRTQPHDTVFIAFAGHGLTLPDYRGDEKSELYLCPMDAEIICDAQTGRFDCRQLLSRKNLEMALRECQASVKILAMDACRNRDVQTRSIAQSDLMTKFAQDEIAKIKEFHPEPVEGLFQLFSCDDGQTAAESEEKKHGVYSYFLIEGLKGAANSNGDHQITLSELQRYVKLQTTRHAKGVLSHDQTPKIIAIGDSTGDDVILASCTPAEIPKPQISDNNSQTAYPSSTRTTNSYNTPSGNSNRSKGGNSGSRLTR